MLSFHLYYNSWQYLLLKYQLGNVYSFPRIKNLIIHIKLTKSTFSALCTGLLVLEMLTSRRSCAVFSKRANLVLKIRKGLPVSCKMTLTGISLFDFLEVFWVFILSRHDVVEVLSVTRTGFNMSTVYNIVLQDIFLLQSLEGLYFDFREFVSSMQIQLNFLGPTFLVDGLVQSLKLPMLRHRSSVNEKGIKFS